VKKEINSLRTVPLKNCNAFSRNRNVKLDRSVALVSKMALVPSTWKTKIYINMVK